MELTGSWTPAHAGRDDVSRAAMRPAPPGQQGWGDADVGFAVACRDAPGVSRCGRHIVAVQGRVRQMRSRQSLSAHELADAIAARGLRAALSDMDGAFVIVHWDRAERSVGLARDPAGQRPLYYGWVDGRLVFGSDLSAVCVSSDGNMPVDRGALALFLRHGYVPAPYSIYQGIYKVLPGSLLVVSRPEALRGPAQHMPGMRQARFWDVTSAYGDALLRRAPISVAAAIEGLDLRLQRAVEATTHEGGLTRTGAFLSGGTDSSLVAALLQAQSERPVPTLGIGFHAPEHDEREWMEAIARHLGVRHETVIFDDAAVLDHVRRIPDAWPEPFADTSQIPTLMASELLATHCTHALTGDGGDELFCGHGAYLRAVRNTRCSAMVPTWLRGWFAGHDQTDRERWRSGGLPALAAELSSTGVAHHYLMRVSRWRDPAALLGGVIEPRTVYRDGPLPLVGAELIDQVQYLDFTMELGNGILTKVGGAAAFCGLSTASPLLDRRVVEFAWQLPTALKQHRGEQKWILKQLLCRYVPAPLVHRPKRGFGPPISAWLRGPLREWAHALLAPASLADADLRDDGRVRRMWDAFQRGERRWHPQLWTVLMYIAWHQRWQRAPAGG